MILLLSKHFPLIIIIITLSIIIENSECFSNHETTTNSPDITTTINSNGNLLDDLRSFILNLKQQNPIENVSNVTDKPIIPDDPPSIEIETTKSPLSPSPPPSIRRRFHRPMLRKISSTNATEPIKIFNGSNRSILQPSSISNVTRRRRLFLRRPTTTISTITTTESPPSTSMITLDEILEQTITESTTMTPVSTTVSQAITTDDDDDDQTMMTTPTTTTTAIPTKRPKKICNDIDTKCNNHNTILTTKTINNSRKNSTTRKNKKNSNRSRNRTAKITTKKRNGKQISSSTLPKTSTQTTTTKKKKKIVAQQIVKHQQPQCEMVVCELPCYIFKTGLDSCPECSCPDPNLDRIQFIATSSFEPAFRLASKRNQSSVFRLN
ncbi:uncharacterized protein LOC113790909 [Dermatophagoides pteronyssinus]|uniref:uncharacterized protein LOC113790909 n=1 Tax=Dermatophagoides pteronyssinus TaxID=6956 RepID=UPI003F663A61